LEIPVATQHQTNKSTPAGMRHFLYEQCTYFLLQQSFGNIPDFVVTVNSADISPYPGLGMNVISKYYNVSSSRREDAIVEMNLK